MTGENWNQANEAAKEALKQVLDFSFKFYAIIGSFVPHFLLTVLTFNHFQIFGDCFFFNCRIFNNYKLSDSNFPFLRFKNLPCGNVSCYEKFCPISSVVLKFMGNKQTNT